MRYTKSVIAASVFLCPLSGFAAGDTYWGVDLALMDIEGIVEPKAAQFTYGKYIVPLKGKQIPVALEGRFGIGIDGDTVEGLEVEVDHYFGGYVRAEFANTTKFSPYGILGYTRGKATVVGIGSDTDSDLSFGFGVRYDYSDQMSIGIEHIEYVEDLESLNIGVRMWW